MKKYDMKGIVNGSWMQANTELRAVKRQYLFHCQSLVAD
jgi:hypothetical protein